VDLSTRDNTEFQVSAILNGKAVATTCHPSKKKAKQIVAETALKIAIEESQAMFPHEVQAI
jgi:dsRNA-specific ribonuclease